MTLWATASGDKVTLHGNVHLDMQIQGSRVTEWAVTEDIGHVRHFWGQLGALINQEEQAAEAVEELEEGLDSGEIPGGF